MDSLTKTIQIEGDYAKSSGSGRKTLRLKINKSDWPDEWSFPWKELDRRLFLQNFRLSNLETVLTFGYSCSFKIFLIWFLIIFLVLLIFT